MADGTYRLRWEMVDQRALFKYCNADPAYYKNVTQTVPNSQIPDEDWQEIVGRTGSREELADQYNRLREWADADKEFVRNVQLDVLASEPEWRSAS